MKVSLDVESTLADASGVFLAEYNHKYGTSWKKDHWTTWSFGKIDVSLEEYLSMTKEIWNERWEIIPPCESELSSTVRKLSDTHEVDIVTARVGCDDSIQAWLRDQNITSYGEFKSCAPGEKHLYDYDIFIDDKPDFHHNVPVQYMPRRPYNEQDWDEEDVIPVDTVAEAVDLIQDGIHRNRERLRERVV